MSYFVQPISKDSFGLQEVASGSVLATNQVKTSAVKQVPNKYPISLDAGGLNRDLGTLTIIVEGIGGNSECDVYINHREVR